MSDIDFDRAPYFNAGGLNPVPAAAPGAAAGFGQFTAPPPPAPAPDYRRFDSLGEYWAAFDELLSRAQREVMMFDVTLGREHDRPHRIDALRALLAASQTHRLRILVHDARALARNCPRVCGLLRQYPGLVSIHRTLPEAHGAADPLLVVDATHALRRAHFRHARSVLITDDPAATRPLRERLEQIEEASETAMSATVLGL